MKLQWDQELESLALDITQLRKQAARLPDFKILQQVNGERAIVQDLLGEIAIAHDRGSQLIRRPSKLMNQASSAIIYWAKQHLTKLRSLTDEFMALQNRKMWLRLLQTRFSESQGEEQITLEARHLVDLVQRRQELAKIEKRLKSELEMVAEFRKGLRLQYEAIATADQNWNASGTMSARLGVDILDARENPSAIALKELMKAAAIPLRHPKESARLVKINQDLDEKSERMAELCSQLASLFVKKGPEAVKINSFNQFTSMIEQVKELNSNAEKSRGTLLSEKIMPARPKLARSAVQDRSVQRS